MSLSGREKATILLSILGTDLSSEVLKHLPPELADLITSGINNLPNPSTQAVSMVLEEFASSLALPSTQRPMLNQVADNIQGDITSTRAARQNPQQPEMKRSEMDVLCYSQPKRIAMALSAERSPVVAFVLSILPQVHAREVLSYMPDRKKDIEESIKSMKQTTLSDELKAKIVPIMAERLERLERQ